MRKSVETILPELKTVRRELHQIPETGFQEFETSNYIYNFLFALKPDKLEKLAGTGVKAVFNVGADETFAFRADMDALPVEENTGLACSSRNPGCMHACGHDGHMAAALMLAKLVSERRSELKKNVVVFFQPSEEMNVGASKMIEDGVLEGPHIDRLFGFHVWPGVEKGKIALRKGPMMANGTHFDIVIHGSSAHGAKPHLGNDAVVAAANLINMIETIVSRRIDPMDDAVITIGSVHGGTQRSIICSEIRLCCTMRTFTDAAHETGLRCIRNMMKAVETAFDVTAELEFQGAEYYTVNNDAACFDIFRDAAGEYAIDAEKVCISEDFSYYQKKTPGCFAFLGLGDDVSPLHSPTMFYEEELLLPILETYMNILDLQ